MDGLSGRGAVWLVSVVVLESLRTENRSGQGPRKQMVWGAKSDSRERECQKDFLRQVWTTGVLKRAPGVPFSRKKAALFRVGRAKREKE